MGGFSNLNGRVAVVTGGASGIGKGIAKQFVAEGMKVVIADVEEGKLQETAREIGAVGIKTDVSSLASVQALAKAVCEQYGTVHVVCNNAGIGSMAPIAQMTLDDWKWILDVNLWGVIYGVNTFLPLLLANEEGGYIVNTSSIGGFATMPNLGAYSVTKAGVNALTETLAQELAAEGSKVGVSVLCPGTVRTNIQNSLRNRPAELNNKGLVDVDLQSTDFGKAMNWMDPEEVGARVVESIKRGDLYILTHPETFPLVKGRLDAITQAFASSKPFK